MDEAATSLRRAVSYSKHTGQHLQRTKMAQPRQQLPQQPHNPFANLASLGIVVPHVGGAAPAPAPGPVPAAAGELVPVGDTSMFDLSVELARVIDGDERIAEYEEVLRQEYQLSVQNVESQAEQTLADRTQMVVHAEGEILDERRAQLVDERRTQATERVRVADDFVSLSRAASAATRVGCAAAAAAGFLGS